MKLIVGCYFFFLLVSVLIPMETEAMDKATKKELLNLVGQNVYKLMKMAYYAKCPVVGAPKTLKCPKFVFGLGMSQNQAITAARMYANARKPGKQCGQYLGECSAFQVTKV